MSHAVRSLLDRLYPGDRTLRQAEVLGALTGNPLRHVLLRFAGVDDERVETGRETSIHVSTAHVERTDRALAKGSRYSLSWRPRSPR